MKIIATSIVLLAAAASAGETSLRLGRELKVPGRENGNKAGKGNGVGTPAATDKGTGKGYGARCCAQFDGSSTLDNADACNANTAAVKDCDETNLNGDLDLSGFKGCEYNATSFECTHIDDDSDSDSEDDSVEE